MENREAFVRRTLVYMGLVSRMLIFLAPVAFFYFSPIPGFRPDQFAILMFLLCPAGCLYIIFLVRFVLRNRYQLPGNALPNNYVGIGYLVLLLLVCGELMVIVAKGLNNTLVDDTWFYFTVALFESGTAMYAALHLSDLFSKAK